MEYSKGREILSSCWITMLQMGRGELKKESYLCASIIAVVL